jgi:Gas vesicle synthesis protein GvpO
MVMAEVRNQRQRERAEARKGRRVEADEPTDQSDSEQSDESDRSDRSGQPSFDLKRVAGTAVTAALAGALAGAAKAVVDKRGRSTQPQRDDGGEDAQEPVSASHEEAGPEPEPERQTTDEGEADEEPKDETQVDAGEPDDREPDDEPARAQEQDHYSEQTGASTADVASMIARAKQHVEAVLGSEPESVSGVELSNGNWRVNVEVVQLRRIPESTDILASYAVMLDGDGDLLSVQELRRYRRSQAEDGR